MVPDQNHRSLQQVKSRSHRLTNFTAPSNHPPHKPAGVTPEQQFVKVMNDELVEIMGAEQSPLARRTDGKPTVILLAGLQGTGKTTAAAKLAKCVVVVKNHPRSVFHGGRLNRHTEVVPAARRNTAAKLTKCTRFAGGGVLFSASKGQKPTSNVREICLFIVVRHE